MPDAPSRSATPFALFAAVGAALVAVLLLAVVTPRMNPDEGVNWLLTLAGGVLVGGITYAALALRRPGGSEPAKGEPPR